MKFLTSWKEKLRNISPRNAGAVLVLDYFILMGIILYGLPFVLPHTYYQVHSRCCCRLTLGLVVFLIIVHIGYGKVLRLAWPLMALSGIIIVCGWFSPPIYGTHKWLSLGSFHIQSADIAGVALILFLAVRLRSRSSPKDWRTLLPVIVLLTLVFLSGNLYAFFLLWITALVMLTVVRGKAAFPYWGILTGFLIAGAGYLAWARPLRFKRLAAFLFPEQFQYTWNYFLRHSLDSIRAGGWFGRQDGPFLTHYRDNGDWLLAELTSRAGWIFLIAMIVGYSLTAALSILLICRLQKREAKLTVAGFSAILLVPAFYNLAMIMGLAPGVHTGIPFIGSGSGSSLAFTLLGLALIISVSSEPTRPDSVAVAPAAENPEPDNTGEGFGQALLPGGVSLEMIWCPPGRFLMGSPYDELGRSEDEQLHEVVLTQGFRLGKFPVTQKQYEALTGQMPSFFSGNNLPVEKISWHDAMRFCEKLTKWEQNAGRLPEGYVFSLPTEAQWEYACRAGSAAALNNAQELETTDGDCPRLNEVGWYLRNSKRTTHPVGEKNPNAFGLYDMHGNVWEWCLDWYGSYRGDAGDPTGPKTGSYKVFRGGSWESDSALCRSAGRAYVSPSTRNYCLGFRLALVPFSPKLANLDKTE